MSRDAAAGALLAVIGAVAVVPAGAAPPEAPPAQASGDALDQSVLQRTFYQTATYQTLSSFDDFAFGFFFAGGAAAGGILVAVNAASESVVNYVHDLVWTLANRATGQSADDTRLVRTATYTGANAARVFGLGVLMTGSPALSLGYVVFNAAADAGVYAANDAAWNSFWPVNQPSTAPAAPETEAPGLMSYLPSVSVTTRDEPEDSRLSFREVASTDGSLFRVVYLPPKQSEGR